MHTALPVVDGLTQTQPDSEPVHARLMSFLAQKPGGAQQDIAEGVAALRRAASRESDEVVKSRIAAAIALVMGDKGQDG